MVGKDYCSSDQSLNYCEDAATQKRLAAWVSFWHKIWTQLSGDAFLTISGIGPILVAGPLAEPMVSAWTDLEFEDGRSPLEEALSDYRICSKDIAEYEAALQAGHFLVVVRRDSGGKPYNAPNAAGIRSSQRLQADSAH